MIEKLKSSFKDMAVDFLQLLLRLSALLVFLTGLVVALPFLFMSGSANLLVVDFEIAAAAGLTGGFLSRILLRKRTFLLQAAASASSIFFCLALLGYISDSRLGLVMAPGELNTAALFRLALSWCTAGLVLVSWRKKRRKTTSISPSSAGSALTPSAAAVSRNGRGIGNQLLRLRPVRTRKTTPVRSITSRKKTLSIKSKQSRKTALKNKRLNKRSSNGKKRVSEPLQIQRVSKTRRRNDDAVRIRKRSAKKLREQIALKGEEEHRCPFCLELVEEDDPRGIKICPICHTYHHADCWAVTGTCQIPHEQQL